MIRKLTEDDARELSAMIRKILYDVNINDTPESSIKELYDEYSEEGIKELSKKRDIYVAVEHDIIGSVAKDENFICTLFVKHRYKGLGKKLLLFIELKIRQEGYDHTWLVSSLSSDGFFRKMGYEETEKQYLDGEVTGIYMRKRW